MLFAPKEKGQGLVEYALILVLVAIVVIAALMILGPIIGNVFSKTVAGIHDAGDPALGVVRIALRPPFLSDHQDTSMPGEMQG